jgi:predicted Zn finger-like uncharacterized protein
MNIRCPECATVFRVDPTRVPPSGVRARCSRCKASFRITPDGLGESRGSHPPTAAERPGPQGATQTETSAPAERVPAAAAPPAAPADSPAARHAAPEQATAGMPAPQESAAAPSTTAVAAPRQSAAAPSVSASTGTVTAAPDTAPPTTPQSEETPRTPVFGSRDPNARAQRIARALVSDIVAYHPQKRDECMAAGTLRTGFREEIMKSWEEYVAQVGLDMAKTTPYFREALNNILAGGQQVF